MVNINQPRTLLKHKYKNKEINEDIRHECFLNVWMSGIFVYCVHSLLIQQHILYDMWYDMWCHKWLMSVVYSEQWKRVACIWVRMPQGAYSNKCEAAVLQEANTPILMNHLQAVSSPRAVDKALFWWILCKSFTHHYEFYCINIHTVLQGHNAGDLILLTPVWWVHTVSNAIGLWGIRWMKTNL